MAVEKQDRSIEIVHLYPKDMNIYGDTGNVQVLKMRLKWRGIGAKVTMVETGQPIPQSADIIVAGGGQDKGQILVQDDLQSKRIDLNAMAKDGVVMFVVCGTYQLFGHRFITHLDESILGIGVFDAETIAGQTRHIGNILIKTPYGELIGYENHSGNTMLANGQKPLGTVISGIGNNDKDKTEGAIVHNVFGTYLHGPLLPKNPALADELLRRALVRKYGDAMLDGLDDSMAEKAAEIAKSRPR